jgi:SAM-dependent methyltransferase
LLSPGNQWPKWRGYGFRRYRSVEFPAYDVCRDLLNDQFDIIIAEQVFEHLLWPYRAVRNVFQMLTPNGALLVTTPFLIRIHNDPEDCSRWDGGRNSISARRRRIRYQSHHDRILGKSGVHPLELAEMDGLSYLAAFAQE